MKVLVTGANGFVGRSLVEEFRVRGHEVVAATRGAAENAVAVGDLDGATDWTLALQGCDAVVHTAARVHQMKEQAADAEALYRRTNVEATLNLARQAVAAGVRRFIFLSSIKSMGEAGRFSETTPCRPEDAYGRSKHEAEQALLTLSAETGLEVVILRLPLIYGAGVKGNFRSLMGVVKKGMPLPLGAVRNVRSLLYVGNLVDLISLCLTHPAAAGRVWLPSDGADVSTAQLIRAIAKAMGRNVMLVPVPPALMLLAAGLIGKGPAAARLFGDLSVDSTPLFQELGWRPPFSLDDGLKATVRWYGAGAT
ncbi:MAG TPA: SDR family oxidoreductase [Ensifer sp.]|nr:SDR family oxidoreductase [Ensifer sp.]